MKLEVEKLNEILEKLDTYSLGQKFTLVAENESSDYWREKSQGEVGTRKLVYNLGIEDLHLQVIEESDSYGEENGITSVKFVRPVTKQVTDFE